MNKIKTIGIIAVLMAFAGIQIIAAQQANDYRAYVTSTNVCREWCDGVNYTSNNTGSNITLSYYTSFVPVYPSETYTLTGMGMKTIIDLAQPTKINDQIATAVKAQGDSFGYNVIRVFVPSYEMKIP